MTKTNLYRKKSNRGWCQHLEMSKDLKLTLKKIVIMNALKQRKSDSLIYVSTRTRSKDCTSEQFDTGSKSME